MFPNPPPAKTSTHTLQALWRAIRDTRTPFYAKLIPLAVLLYGILPFDLLPDFIPFIGLIDDALLIPFGIWLAVTLIPSEVISEVAQELPGTVRAFKKRIVIIAISAATIALCISIALGVAIIQLVRSF